LRDVSVENPICVINEINELCRAVSFEPFLVWAWFVINQMISQNRIGFTSLVHNETDEMNDKTFATEADDGGNVILQLGSKSTSASARNFRFLIRIVNHIVL
jgi:hypothetical protein